MAAFSAPPNWYAIAKLQNYASQMAISRPVV